MRDRHLLALLALAPARRIRTRACSSWRHRGYRRGRHALHGRTIHRLSRFGLATVRRDRVTITRAGRAMRERLRREGRRCMPVDGARP